MPESTKSKTLHLSIPIDLNLFPENITKAIAQTLQANHALALQQIAQVEEAALGLRNFLRRRREVYEQHQKELSQRWSRNAMQMGDLPESMCW